MALPLARQIGPVLTDVEQELTELTHRIKQVTDLEGERVLLDRITDISARSEEQAAAAAYRFGAARAYDKLVAERVEELRENRVEGFQTIGEFMDRRLAPAMRTCVSVSDRLEGLAQRVTRAAELLRTRIDLELESQNRDLLSSMDQRAKLQLRLQETVEGLSIAAITYYLAGLLGYFLVAADSAGVAFDRSIIQAAAIPVIAILTWYALRRWRRRLQKPGLGSVNPSN